MKTLRLCVLLLATLTAASAAHAEPPIDAPITRDAPARAARLSFMEGTVSFRAAGSDAWGEGTLNRPVTLNDRIWADADSRAELHLGSSAIRLAGRTSVAVTNLDEHTLQVSVSEGTIGVHIRDLPKGNLVEVDTPTAAITLRGVGAYRISVDNVGTSVVVRRGNAEALSGGDAFEIAEHNLASILGEAGKTTHVLQREPAADGFDLFCDARDKREDNPPSLQYVSRDTVGYEDLDAYGGWQQTDSYGPVWTPQNVDADWAPYQDGRWSWIEPWGWSWIDVAAWGFAPFHYGRWVHWGSRWSWAPGPLNAYPVYAPALVGFIGTGGYGYNGYRDPLVGWFPLGWNEAYVPGYYASYRYVRQLNNNVVDVRNINLQRIHQTQIYMNRSVPGAVTAVPRGIMQGAQPISGHRVTVPTNTLTQSPVTGFTPRVVPHIASVVAAQPAHNQPPVTVADHPVMSRHAPAPAAVPFAQREPALQQSAGRPMVNNFRGAPVYSGTGAVIPPRPTTPTPYSHPGAPTPHAPQVIGPHPSPPRFSPAPVHYVGQPAREQPGAAQVYRVPQPLRYEGPVYSSAPRYNAPVPHYNAPGAGGGYAPHYNPAPRVEPHFTAPRINAPAPHFFPPAGHVGGRR